MGQVMGTGRAALPQVGGSWSLTTGAAISPLLSINYRSMHVVSQCFIPMMGSGAGP